MEEHLTVNQGGGGSSPSGCAIYNEGEGRMSRRDWYLKQFSHWPIHMILSLVGWGFLVFCGGVTLMVSLTLLSLGSVPMTSMYFLVEVMDSISTLTL